MLGLETCPARIMRDLTKIGVKPYAWGGIIPKSSTGLWIIGGKQLC